MRATVLVLVENVNAYLPHLEDLGFRLILAPTPQTRAQAIRDHAAQLSLIHI